MAAVLANFPFKNQLAESDPNIRFDCVAVSFASAIQWYTHTVLTGASLKDAEYGRTYIGGTALRRYVDDNTDRARQVYGITATPYTAEPPNLVAQVHTLLRQGSPVIATIPSTWGIARTDAQLDASNFSTHVVCFYGETAGYNGLQAMNPWGGFNHVGSDAYWRARLCDRQVWRVYRVSGSGTTPGGTPVSGVPSGWTDNAAFETLNASNGIPVTKNMRLFVLGQDWDPKNVPLEEKHYNGPVGIQTFKNDQVCYTDALGSYFGNAGEQLLNALADADNAHKQLAALQTQLDTTQLGLNKLAQANQELQAQLAAAQAGNGGGVDPLATAAKAALRAWLAE